MSVRNENSLSNSLSRAMESWAAVVGSENVISDVRTLEAAGQTTFESNVSIPAIVMPASTREVEKCVEIANEFVVPIYPISRGRNWGFGSKVPCQSDSVLLDLRRMNRIIEYNDELGYVTLEPGVTFEQVYQYQQSHNTKHFLSVIGGPGDASVIGNYLERGTGLGMMGERPLNACDAQIVLGRGDVVRTGYGSVENSRLAPLHRWGVGASIDGLFCQSNFGVATRLTVWLNKRPNYFESVVATFKSDEQFFRALEQCRELLKQGVLHPYNSFFWNHVKIAAAFAQHPHPGENKPVNWESLIAKHSGRFKKARWVLAAGLNASSKQIARAKRKTIQNELKPTCNSLRFIGGTTAGLARLVNTTLNSIGLGKYCVDMQPIDALYSKSPMLGHPSTTAVSSVYWRKKFKTPDTIAPDRDRCGVQWVCHEVPFRSEDIAKAINVVEQECEKFGFEPNIAMPIVSNRYIRFLFALMYDLEREGEDDKARDCVAQSINRLNEFGYTSFRHGIQTMQHLPDRNSGNLKLLQDLKQLFDPNGIVAPGRYEKRQLSQCQSTSKGTGGE